MGRGDGTSRTGPGLVPVKAIVERSGGDRLSTTGERPSPTARVKPRSVRAPGRKQLWIPLVSVGLYAIGQLVLTLAIAIGEIGPLTGITVCLLWMVCGLLLVIAQVLGRRGEDLSGES